MTLSFEEELLDLLNQTRVQAGLDPLSSDPLLTNAAENHSESMAADDFFSHTGADNSSPFERMQLEGYQFRAAGENLAAGYSTPESVLEAWMNSPGHRANILNSNFTEIGVGYDYLANDTGSVNYGHYWTLDFGTPL